MGGPKGRTQEGSSTPTHPSPHRLPQDGPGHRRAGSRGQLTFLWPADDLGGVGAHAAKQAHGYKSHSTESPQLQVPPTSHVASTEPKAPRHCPKASSGRVPHWVLTVGTEQG